MHCPVPYTKIGGWTESLWIRWVLRLLKPWPPYIRADEGDRSGQTGRSTFSPSHRCLWTPEYLPPQGTRPASRENRPYSCTPGSTQDYQGLPITLRCAASTMVKNRGADLLGEFQVGRAYNNRPNSKRSWIIDLQVKGLMHWIIEPQRGAGGRKGVICRTRSGDKSCFIGTLNCYVSLRQCLQHRMFKYRRFSNSYPWSRVYKYKLGRYSSFVYGYIDRFPRPLKFYDWGPWIISRQTEKPDEIQRRRTYPTGVLSRKIGSGFAIGLIVSPKPRLLKNP